MLSTDHSNQSDKTGSRADSEVPAALGSCVALALSCRAAALQQPSDLCAGATRALRGTLPFLTPAAAASTAWSLVAEEGGKLHAMDEWIDRLAQAQVATEVERMRRAPREGRRKNIQFAERYFKSNSLFFFLRRRWCRPPPPQNGVAGEGFRPPGEWSVATAARGAPHVVLDLADWRAHNIYFFPGRNTSLLEARLLLVAAWAWNGPKRAWALPKKQKPSPR